MADKISPWFFDSGDYRLLKIVNDVLDKEHLATAEADTLLRPYLHPHGIKTLVSGSNLRIALAVINLLSTLEKGRAKDRILALRSLHDEVLSSSGSLRRNTARVLIQIMKTLVRSRGDELEQLKLAHDFRQAASGRPTAVREQLRKYHLLEMPEEWNQICFDDRVHDANTKGRKTPTHLIMDAWIKGIRRLTVVYYHFVDPSVVKELLEAAKIMDVEVHIGVQFTALHRGSFVQLVWEPKGFDTYAETSAFLCSESTQKFLDHGREVGRYTQQYVLGLVEAFNNKHRHSIKTTYGLELSPIKTDDFLAFVGKGQPSINHFASFIHKCAYPLMKEKVVALYERYDASGSKEEREGIEAEIKVYDELDADCLANTYLLPGVNPNLVSYIQPAEDDPETMKLSVAELVAEVQKVHSINNFTLNTVNLTQADVIELLYLCDGKITALETFSLKDLTEGRFRDAEALGKLRMALNRGDVVALKRMILDNVEIFCLDGTDCHQESDEVSVLNEIVANVDKLASIYVHQALESSVGSGSTGSYSGSFGMGFVVIDTLPVRAQKEYARRLHQEESVCLPLKVMTSEKYIIKDKEGLTPLMDKIYEKCCRLPFLRRFGKSVTKSFVVAGRARVVSEGCGNIAILGGLTETRNNFSLDKERRQKKKRIPLSYLGSTARNWLKVFVGLVPAFLTFSLTKDWWLLAYFGAFIWFGITGVRNVIQSVVGGGGMANVRSISLLRWDHYVNWGRVTDSLLYTGFSVPLLDYLCKTLLLDQSMGITTTTAPIALYSIMGVTNGLYICSHNLFRGLPKEAAFWNLFRSILSIPVAVLFNWVVGSVLGLFGVVGVGLILQKWAAVISKLASDCVAGIIEGNADRGVNVHMRVWDYRVKIKQFFHLYAKVETCFPKSRAVSLMAKPDLFVEKLAARKSGFVKALIFDSLDFMTFWYYQPRAITGLGYILRDMDDEKRCIFFMSQLILTQEKEVAKLLVEGHLGSQFGKSLSFYLDNYKAYLQQLDKMLVALGTTEHRSLAGKALTETNNKLWF